MDLGQKLKQAEERYRLVAENLVDAIWVLDAASMQYLYVSPSVEGLRGYSAEEVMGGGLERHLTPQSLAKVKAAMAEEIAFFQRGVRRKRVLELKMLRKDGGEMWVEVIGRLFEQDGRLCVIGVTRDIDRRKNLELERGVLISKLERALDEEKRLRRENRVLRGLLPICSYCRRIRDENGQWQDLEAYVAANSETKFTHTICPPCKKQNYPELG